MEACSSLRARSGLGFLSPLTVLTRSRGCQGGVVEGRRHRGWSVPRRGCSCRVLVKASSERLPGSDRGPLDPGYISTLPKAKQGLITAGIAAGMLFLTLALNDLVVPVLRTVPTAQPASRLIGLIYLVTGITHFTNLDGFCDVYPERGAWGWWYLPGSAKFHVEWTGVAEVLGGIAVLFGDLPIMPDWVGPYGALGLLVLTIVVTPANFYSITHGKSGPVKAVIPFWAHIIRALLQPALLSILYSLATGYHT